jgi:dTDP-4-dehydrorhamnose 3,5-epimerase
MKITATELQGVVLLEPTVFGDDRGWFYESYNETKFHEGLKALGLPVPRPFIQDNHSCSARGVLRGLHYQLAPRAQGKLVRVTKGRAWDVAVDIRRGSPHFGRWVGLELSEANRRQLWIPEGFAHGFLSLEDGTEFLYKTTDLYDKRCERAIRWDDAQLGIPWPAVDVPLQLAAKDEAALHLDEAELP